MTLGGRIVSRECWREVGLLAVALSLLIQITEAPAKKIPWKSLDTDVENHLDPQARQGNGDDENNRREIGTLRALLDANGIPLVLESGLSGQDWSIPADAETQQEKLDAVAEANRLTCYFDGTCVRMSPKGSVGKTVVKLDGFSVEELVERLDAHDLYDETQIAFRASNHGKDFEIREVGENLAVVGGTPWFMEVVRGFAEVAQDEAGKTGEDELAEPIVVPLKHAFAADISLGGHKIPGVASGFAADVEKKNNAGKKELGELTLAEFKESAKKLWNGERLVPPVEDGTATSTPRGAVEESRELLVKEVPPIGGTTELSVEIGGSGVRDTGLTILQNTRTDVGIDIATNTPVSDAGAGETPARSQEKKTDTPRFQIKVIAGTNSIGIIAPKGEEAWQAEMKEKVEKRDVAVNLVEVTAAIVDIETDVLFEWGSESLGKGKSQAGSQNRQWAGGINAPKKDTRPAGDVESPFGRVLDRGADGPLFGSGLVEGGGLNASGIITGAGYEILSRVSALEGEGRARMLSRPSIVTVENCEATLSDLTSQFLPVKSEHTAKLFQVESGLQLKVTPKVLDTGHVSMDIDIIDGTLGDSSNLGAAPTSTNNRISTNALVLSGQSLLIGGRYFHEKRDLQAGVPLVGRIPVLGYAFKRKELTQRKFQRLYLITPKIIPQSSGSGESEEELPAEKGMSVRSPEELREAAAAGDFIPEAESIDTPSPAKRPRFGRRVRNLIRR